jgi:hypothetical protein
VFAPTAKRRARATLATAFHPSRVARSAMGH